MTVRRRRDRASSHVVCRRREHEQAADGVMSPGLQGVAVSGQTERKLPSADGT